VQIKTCQHGMVGPIVSE